MVEKGREELLSEIAELTEQLREMDRARAKKTAESSKETLRDLRERIQSNPQNTDPQKLKTDVERAVFEAERKYSTGADKLRHAVAMLHDMGYDTTNTLKNDGTQYDDLIRASIEAQVYELNIVSFENKSLSISQDRRIKAALDVLIDGKTQETEQDEPIEEEPHSFDKASRAETSEEFKAKYENKRFNKNNIGLAFALEYLYAVYLFGEDKDQTTPLFSGKKALRHAQILSELSDEERKAYSKYGYMMDVCRTKFQYAVAIRNSTLRDLLSLSILLLDTICTESALSKAKDKGFEDDDTFKELREYVALSSFNADSKRNRALTLYRRSIETNLKYMLLHNTFIELCSEVFDMPELDILKVNVEGIKESKIATDEFITDTSAKADESLKRAFSLIQEPPPIPGELRKALYSDLKQYRDAESCFNNLIECYYNGRGMEAYSYG